MAWTYIATVGGGVEGTQKSNPSKHQQGCNHRENLVATSAILGRICSPWQLYLLLQNAIKDT